MAKTDVLVRSEGNLVSFDFVSKHARNWIANNKDSFAPWQFLGKWTVTVDRRVASDLCSDLSIDVRLSINGGV